MKSRRKLRLRKNVRKVKKTFRRRQRYTLKGGKDLIKKFANEITAEYDKILHEINLFNKLIKANCTQANEIVAYIKVSIPALETKIYSEFSVLKQFKSYFYYDFVMTELKDEETKKLIQQYMPIMTAFQKILGIFTLLPYQDLISKCSKNFNDPVNQTISTYVQLNNLLKEINESTDHTKCNKKIEEFLEVHKSFNTNNDTLSLLSINDKRVLHYYEELIEELTNGVNIHGLKDICKSKPDEE
jgi:ribosomal protein S15P/S13E